MTGNEAVSNHRPPFGAVEPLPAIYRGVREESFYLTMRDGVRLAADVYLPAGLPAGQRLPALLTQTRYWRQSELRPPFSRFLSPDRLRPSHRPFKPFFTGRGYALVYVDVRGTGASFGEWPYPWDQASFEDTVEILDWIVGQPWCSGRVGAFGVSYMGNTAELAAATGHPALKAVVPRFNHPNPFTDIGLPGGIRNDRFVCAWSEMDDALDRNQLPSILGRLARLLTRGVKPVRGDRQSLAQAVAGHAANMNTRRLLEEIVCADEPSALGVSPAQVGVDPYHQELASSGAAVFGWGSWMDAGTADAALRRFLTYENASRAVIGAWEHGGEFHASPYQRPGQPADPPLAAQWAEMAHFFDAFLKDTDNGVRDRRTLFYYTLGAEEWRQSDRWPPPGARPERFYLAAGRSLSPQPPQESEGADRYVVDFDATTGLRNRWWELSGALRETVVYDDRAAQEGRLLSYTSAPLEAGLEISGYPVAHLYLSSSEPDGAVYVYLEDVSPSGRVTYLTEGQLRLIHRRLSDRRPPLRLQVPYRAFSQADLMPMQPGQVAEIAFGLLPVSALIRRGHRLRVSFAGHDQGTFVRIPEQGRPVYEIQRGREQPSFVELPVVR
jgi:uncharacterized protein